MSGGFVKIYGNRLLRSSVWLKEDAPTRVLWITMLALADARGFVDGPLLSLADAAKISREECEAGLARLIAPDSDSRTKRHDGRRIRPLRTGWQILNYVKHREMRSEKQIKDAERKQAWRKSKAGNASQGDMSRMSHAVHAEVEAEADITTTTPPTPTAPDGAGRKKRARSALPPYDQLFEEAFATYPRRDSSKAGAWRQWLDRVREGVDPLVMVAGTVGYKRQCEREQREQRFIKHAQTFYGRDRHFEADFGPATEPPLVDEWGCLTAYGDQVTRPTGAKPMLVA